MSEELEGLDRFEMEFKSHVIGGGGVDDFRLNIRSMAMNGDVRCEELLEWSEGYVSGVLLSRGLESWMVGIGELYKENGEARELSEIREGFHRYLSHLDCRGRWVLKGEVMGVKPERRGVVLEERRPELKEAVKTLELDKVLDGEELIAKLRDVK